MPWDPCYLLVLRVCLGIIVLLVCCGMKGMIGIHGSFGILGILYFIPSKFGIMGTSLEI